MPALLLGSISTVADTSELQRQAFNQAFETHGLNWRWDQDQYRAMLSTSGGQARIAEYAQSLGQTVDAKAVHETKSRIFQDRLAQGGLAPRPGVVDSGRPSQTAARAVLRSPARRRGHGRHARRQIHILRHGRVPGADRARRLPHLRPRPGRGLRLRRGQAAVHPQEHPLRPGPPAGPDHAAAAVPGRNGCVRPVQADLGPAPHSRPTYWIYHEIWRLAAEPASSRSRLKVIFRGKDAIFDWADPLPFLMVHHVQIPWLLVRNLLRLKDWIRIDFNIGKLVEPDGD
jgi:hypothetical protein